MSPGYQDVPWWWKVALHLDETQLALANAMAHNVDDPRLAQALYDRLREGQAVLLDIFHMKGILPGSVNGRMEAPMTAMPVHGASMPAVMVPTPSEVSTTDEAQAKFAVEWPAVSEVDQIAVQPEQSAAAPRPEMFTSVVPIASELAQLPPVALGTDNKPQDLETTRPLTEGPQP